MAIQSCGLNFAISNISVMRKHQIITAVSLAFMVSNAIAQNLVINPYFIPTKDSKSEAQIYLAPGYSSPNAGTTDFYSRSASSHEVGIPKNFVGSQDIVGTDHYAGIIAYYADEVNRGEEQFPKTIGYGRYTEYLQVELREALQAGATYKVSFDASLADNSAFATSLAIFFAEGQVNDASNTALDVAPQLNNNTVITDKENWVKNGYDYVAKGGERFLIIGRFGEAPTQKVVAPNANNNRRAYYYLSNVVVEMNADKIILSGDSAAPVNFDELLSGKVFILPNLNFETNLNAIELKAYQDLDKLGVWMMAHPDAKIKIEGHTDKTGRDGYNQRLSENRANATKKYLLHLGVAETAITTAGFGSTRLLENGPANNIKNRRVEISLQ